MTAQLSPQDLARFKQSQQEAWVHFAPLEVITMPCAAHLVRFAGVSAGMKLLDVGCGTGVVAVTAARSSADVEAIDLTPQLLDRARENSEIASVPVNFREGDVEQLPFRDGQFDIVLSQFAHMFAPRPEVALSEMLRVLKPGGIIAFATWPPEMLVGITSTLGSRYMSPAAPGLVSPRLWGDPAIIKDRLANNVTNLSFDRGRIMVPALSPQHFRTQVERSVGPVIQLIEDLQVNAPERLQEFRKEFDDIVSRFFRDNLVRQEYLLSRALKNAP